MRIDKNHPRYASLIIREKLTRGVKLGITSPAGLIAQGRGEAFDYFLGEKTTDSAKTAIYASASLLIISKNPVISVNGNTAAICAPLLMKLAKIIDADVEVNLFHYSKQRIKIIENTLANHDPKRVLISAKEKKIKLPGIASKRAITIRDGIAASDCVFVPLEDGDRAQALRKLGKKVITVDLNPLSRTARNATITIVDNIARCMPLLIEAAKNLVKKDIKTLNKIISGYDNVKNLNDSYNIMIENLKSHKNEKRK